MPEPDEVRALSRLAARELGGGAAGLGGVHAAVAERVFAAVGPSARPVQLAHDAVARTVYGGLRGAATLAGETADERWPSSRHRTGKKASSSSRSPGRR
jgi:hypothetical protein